MASKKKNKSSTVNKSKEKVEEKDKDKAVKENKIEVEENRLKNENIKKEQKEQNKQKQKEIEEKVKKLSEKIEEIEDTQELEKKSQINSDDKKEENALVKSTQKNLQAELIEQKIEKKRKKIYLLILILLIIIILFVCSTIFAILNIGNSNFTKGVKIKNIDVSGLTIEEAKNKMNEALNIELIQDLKLKYGNDYETTLDVSQIEFLYNLEDAISEGYKVGRNGNILENNYEILMTTFFEKNIDVKYSFNEEYLEEYIKDVESKIPGLVVQPTYYIEENELIINNGTDGIEIDKEKLKTDILSTINNRNAKQILENNNIQELEIPVISKKTDSINIEKIYSEVYTEPKNAYYDLEPFKIYPEVNGVDLEIGLEEAKKQISTENREEYIFKLKITLPEKTIKELGTEAFPYLISSFSTKYDASNVNRSKNLAIAAEKINGTVLLPGEVFSFNKVVGKRTVEEGYKDAKIYVDGGVVDGLAGGICQISSTLYNVVLLANLEVVERRNHSFTTSYVPAGRDATVVYGTTDFQFKNSRNYPIKIEASVSNGIAEFKIHGIAEENEYEIKIIPVTTQSIPYNTQYIQDATLAPGQQLVVQAGHSGYKVTTYKEIRQSGVLISREQISSDTYKAMQSIIRIAP